MWIGALVQEIFGPPLSILQGTPYFRIRYSAVGPGFIVLDVLDADSSMVIQMNPSGEFQRHIDFVRVLKWKPSRIESESVFSQ